MLELIEEHACHGGVQRIYRHESFEIGLSMRFSVYLPPQARAVPGLFFLAGPTCTKEKFAIKAEAQHYAARYGVALISPDTSPCGANFPGEAEAWDFGIGAGFYVDATIEPWSKHWRMYSYVRDELRQAATSSLPIDGARLGIFGHSMGGHGALVLALRNWDLYQSMSAFAPIAAPTLCPWGEEAFSGYLGDDREAWKQYDASELVVRAARKFEEGILVDQGMADQFLARQLNPDVFEQACRGAGQPLTLRRHENYDHGFYFIQSFIKDHIEHHARLLLPPR
ncbi:S-formylglutathione hydrolase [Burkholderia sp. BCC1999]|uniref:S-formylglutathione hydrolase n=1 Tax=Burkholderia sp. BCC1999 TaxID=2817448 RepID=UPI002AC34936|nr:S-formylglutathione hydrolase [Burkholderia sp. BCC1999]